MLLLHPLALICLLPLLAFCAEDFYKLLQIDKDASERQIKKAYRTLSKKYHPDKNPGNDTANKKFVEIAEAYEVLVEDETRKIYDQYGHEGIERHKKGGQRGGGGGDPFDIFSRFFGGGGGGGGGGRRRGPSMEVRINVPLRDFYTGRDHDFKIVKQATCDKCDGSGSADGQRQQCQKCSGQGIVVQKHMVMPGMFQQVQMQCDACGGKGSTVKHKCKTCGGSRHVREEERYEMAVEKGMPNGARLTYEGEADESPDYEAGDLIVQLVEKEPELGGGSGEENGRTDGTFFRRKDSSLFWTEVLSLREAWMGDWQRNLTHLDGHVVHLHRKRGEVVQPGTVEVVEGEGMPIWRHEDGPEYGDLLVDYVVVLPDQMDASTEKEFFAVFEKGRKKRGVDLGKDSGRPAAAMAGHAEL